MASKVALVNGEERPTPKRQIQKSGSGGPSGPNRIVAAWSEFTHFLSDVRGEMRKVVTPSRKEVEATTTVVLIAVFLFGLFFFVVDSIFDLGLHQLLARLGGLQQ
jgi:preprotein translocase subunit SecE